MPEGQFQELRVNGVEDTWDQLIRLRAAVDKRNEFHNSDQAKVSIITPTWNTKSGWLYALAMSVLEQTYTAWEWCIVDDASTESEFYPLLDELEQLGNVRVLRLAHGLGISGATNEGLKASTGEYVCFVDHDDLLAADALQLCVNRLDKGFDAVYTDSDKVDEQGERSEPFHKPSWSPEFFRGVMYVGHLLCVRRLMAQSIGGFDSAFDGIQDYDFVLRLSEQTQRIAHIDRILYHWRMVSGSVASSSNAKGDLSRLQTRAVQNHLDRIGLRANAEPGLYAHRVRVLPKPRLEHPRISIIIPTKDSPEVLRQCLYSIFSRTRYSNVEVICVDNETTDPEALREMSDAPVERILFPGKFNFSKANNLGVAHSDGEYLVFMNNDIEVLSEDWVEQMLYYAEQDDVGAVGALLMYPDRTVQHAGVVLGCRGTADHVLRRVPECDGYAGSMSCAHEVSAVTAACMMMSRRVYDEVGGFNEHFFTAYQDVDLCLKIRSAGKRIIFTPHAKFIHHESLSRGSYYDFVDRNLLLDYWEPLIKVGDPYFNRNFDVQKADYSLAGQ